LGLVLAIEILDVNVNGVAPNSLTFPKGFVRNFRAMKKLSGHGENAKNLHSSLSDVR